MERADNPPRPTGMLNSAAHRCTKLHGRRQNTNSYIFAAVMVDLGEQMGKCNQCIDRILPPTHETCFT